MKIDIIGAGMTGLIVGAILRNNVGQIYDKQETLPSNHNALLRFKTNAISVATGIKFNEVLTYKQVHNSKGPITDGIAYSYKTTGQYSLDRSISNIEAGPQKRFIAPTSFIEELGLISKDNLALGQEFDHFNEGEGSVISTIPMPLLMDILGWQEAPEFNYHKGVVITVYLSDDFIADATIYYPSPEERFYRASITGSKLIIESVDMGMASSNPAEIEHQIKRILISFGVDAYQAEFMSREYDIKEAPIMKILPIDEAIRNRFILWASEEFGVYSLGRYATWRPKMMLDDIPNDLNVIREIIAGSPEPKYKQRKQSK